MDKRIFAIGDIHGGLKALKHLVEMLQLNPEDQLIFLSRSTLSFSASVVEGIEFVILLQANGAIQLDLTLNLLISNAMDFDNPVIPSFAAE